MNAIIDFFRWLFGIQDPPAPTNPCEAAPCVNARNQLNGARARFQSICNGIRGLRQVLSILNQILSTPWWVLVAAALIAILVGGLIALGLWALIGLWGISWVLALVIGRMLVSLGQSLAQAAMDVASAIPQVVANCPENCRGDLSIPTCN